MIKFQQNIILHQYFISYNCLTDFWPAAHVTKQITIKFKKIKSTKIGKTQTFDMSGAIINIDYSFIFINYLESTAHFSLKNLIQIFH